MLIYRFGTISALLSCLVGCVSDPQRPAAGRVVIDQTPGASGLPAWTEKGNKFQDTDGRIAFKGFLTMDSDARPDACTHAAGIDAKGRIASMISTSVLETSGISTDEKNIVYSRLVAALANQKFSGLEIADEYWNLIEINDGMSQTRKLECWAKVTIAKTVLDKAMARALREVGDDPTVKEHRTRLDEGIKKLEKQEGVGE
jgi:hypothetical protein